MTGRLAGKRSVVTGAGSGIGRAIAERFAAEGAKVAIVDVDVAAAEGTLAAIESASGTGLVAVADVADEPAIAAAIGRVVEDWGGLDVVVANAGIQLFGQDDRVDRLALEVWDATLRVNLTGAFLTCKHAVRAMLSTGGGRVICTSSPTAIFGLAPGFDAYTASKAGVHGLARVMAADYASEGILVNAIVPGFTDTNLVAAVFDQPAAVEGLLRSVPLGRPGAAEEVASVAVFLASDEASYITGAAFTVDGGMTAI